METDYLVIGGGATAMAFVDTLLDETDANVILVDRRAAPGGHWNDAYSFVGLHQPSAYYGVNSTEFGSRQRDAHGPNAGFFELASGPEVSAYFDRVLRQRFLPGGRVRWLPSTEHLGEGRLRNLLSGAETRVDVRRRTVDATFMAPTIPANHRPGYAIAEGARVLPPNDLPRLWLQGEAGRGTPRTFCVLGAGKTALDAIVWLLRQGTPADAIQWVMPRDPWLQNRLHTQPGLEFFEHSMGGEAERLAAFAAARSIDELFERLEEAGLMLRIDRNRTPTMFHYATLSTGELELLRTVTRVIRLGHVRGVAPEALELDGGRVAIAPGTVHVDCTASGVRYTRPHEPVFGDGRIVLQLLRAPLPTFSAALAAWVEAHGGDDATRNRLCTPVPFPRDLAGYARAMLGSLLNQAQWSQDPALRAWMRSTRLDAFGALAAQIAKDDAPRQAVLGRLRAGMKPAMENMQRLAAAAA